MSQLGMFKTVARTELKDKCPGVSDDVLHYLNYAIQSAYDVGLIDGANLKSTVKDTTDEEEHF